MATRIPRTVFDPPSTEALALVVLISFPEPKFAFFALELYRDSNRCRCQQI
jgi:hypothetical protein